MRVSKNSVTRLFRRIRGNFFVVGLLSLAWFAFRSGTKPTRAVYPCQRTAAVNGSLWLSTYLLTPLTTVAGGRSWRIRKKEFTILILIVIACSSIILVRLYQTWDQPNGGSTDLIDGTVDSTTASHIFMVEGTSGNDGGVAKLITVMGTQQLLFYQSDDNGPTAGPTGLFGHEDTIIVKVNCQWDQRGGTNTDLLKALIQALVEHPDGFTGEIVVADNGQGRGSLDWSLSNAENRSQSVQHVVDRFASSWKVSTFLWDTIRAYRVEEYAAGDLDDGYVVNATADAETGLRASYPKFRTAFGTYISFKLGVWDPTLGSYDSGRLKVINVPVLKTHTTYGVTAATKHYMGVVSQVLTDAHSTVGRGGMGTQMAATRFPTLNILDAIWVNAKPSGGPWTSYNDAIQLNTLAASTDPIALDYWASKTLLIPAANQNGYINVSSMDPENTAPGAFGDWLRASMHELTSAGFTTTVDELAMTIHIAS